MTSFKKLMRIILLIVKKAKQIYKQMPKIKLYSTPVCIWCAKTREFFRKHKIKYMDIDVSRDRKAATEMIHKSGQMGVPVIDIDGKIVVGYNEEKLKSLLKINKG